MGFALLLALFILFWTSLPEPLFKDPWSTVVTDRNDQLLGARIAKDGQWRFPGNPDVPEKFMEAIRVFEDKNYYVHPGIDPLALARAIYLNVKHGRIVSGGSTLSMQVIRLSRKGKPRTIAEKFIEMVLALRLELRYSKREIAALYAAHAPFGGNVVGLEAAAWRYFGREPQELSWAEAATLAVLPNAPSLIHPGRNRETLLQKRNDLLHRLFEDDLFDSITLIASLPEMLPDEPAALPSFAPHLVNHFYLTRPGERVPSTIDPYLQQKVNSIASGHMKLWTGNHVYNCAILVAEVNTGDVLAYVGNNPAGTPGDHGFDVDITRAPRSSGSVLKPLLYAAMNQSGEILPAMLVPDKPVQMAGFTPKNYSLDYDGVVPADRALSRSLNIPSVFMLQEYGVPRFHGLLNRMGFSTVNRSPDHYGLSLILGGAEISLWDLVGAYCSMSRVLTSFYSNSGRYYAEDHHPLNLDRITAEPVMDPTEGQVPLEAGAIWQTYEAMWRVNRPESLREWQSFSSMGKVAWKTGTSFGFRDAWAVGTTPGYVVGVWVGNADGEGRPGLTGLNAAAPILFDVFSALPDAGWFDPPFDELHYVPVCAQSGHRPGMHCPDTIYQWVCTRALNTEPCPYHVLAHLDQEGKYRVASGCNDAGTTQTAPWFVLPPVEEYYYAQRHADYRPLPELHPGCGEESQAVMDFIFPTPNSRIYVPVELDGETGKTVFRIAHRSPESTLFWHLDREYLGETSGIHQMGLSPGKGKHVVTVVDRTGNSVSRAFEIVSE